MGCILFTGTWKWGAKVISDEEASYVIPPSFFVHYDQLYRKRSLTVCRQYLLGE